jgi:hypothetical protein
MVDGCKNIGLLMVDGHRCEAAAMRYAMEILMEDGRGAPTFLAGRGKA